MKIIHRYILRELIASFALSLVALNVVMMTETVMRTAMLFAGVGAPMSAMLKMVALIQPQAAVYTIPLALMISVLLTYGRMNASREIAVLRTGGMPLYSLALPAFIMAGGCLITGLLLTCIISPASAKMNNALIRDVLSTRAPYAIREGIFTSAFRDVAIFVQKKPSMDSMEGVFIHDHRNQRIPSVLTAKRGRVTSPDGRNLTLTLSDGSMHLGSEGSATDITFDRYVMQVPIEARITKARLRTAEMTPPEILGAAKASKLKLRRDYAMMELHRRFTLPLMSVCVALFSIPLGIGGGRGGKLGGIGRGLGLVVAFYLLSAVLESMFKSGAVPSVAAGWLPIMMLFMFSLFLYRKEGHR